MQSDDSLDSEDSGGEVGISLEMSADWAEKMDEGDPPPNKKLRKDVLRSQPTSEELHALKDTANLFHSTLFRLQVEEMLAEVKVQTKPSWQEWLVTLTRFLSHLPNGETYDLVDQRWAETLGVRVPIWQVPYNNKGIFRFATPVAVRIVGSYPVGLSVRPDVTIDVAVQMPKECFHHSDRIDHRYHRKRALYLLCLAHHLQKCDFVGELRFTHFNGDHLKPVLLARPSGRLAKKFRVCIHPFLAEGFFKPAQLSPYHNNVRTSWMFEESKENEDVPTPRYNSSLLMDALLPQHFECLKSIDDMQSIKDGIILLKVWTRHRQLDRGHGAFTPFLQAMFVLYLLRAKKLNGLMSSYQIVRNAWVHLAKRDWIENGITMEQGADHQQALPDFRVLFEVVFVAPSGLLNLAADMSLVTLERVRYEAEMALACLDAGTNSFDVLFMSPVPFVSAFDHLVRIDDCEKLREACDRLGLCSSSIDGRGPTSVVLPNVIECLRQGLGRRVRLLDVQLREPPVWEVTDDAPNPDQEQPLSIGLLLDAARYATAVERGPSAETPEALEFHKFWGDVSELRHFQDGSICEAVVWPCGTVAQRRLVCKRIVLHVLSRHFSIPDANVLYFGGELDDLLDRDGREGGRKGLSTGEEGTLAVLKEFDVLSKQLRNLHDMVLAVNSIVGVSPVFRYTEVFPPRPFNPHVAEKTCQVSGDHFGLKRRLVSTPPVTEPMEVLVQLESSGKWPQDVEALRRLKAAFHAKMGELLRQHYSRVCSSRPDRIDVLTAGYVFRITIANPREVSALKAVKTNAIVKYKSNDRSLALEMKIITLPKTAGALHSVQMQHDSYGVACRLVKRWISAQLLLDYFPELVVELVVAHLYLAPEPFSAPSCPQIGFLRFLQLVSLFDWKNTPMIVNFNGELTESEVSEIRNRFVSERRRLPAMFVATPHHKFESYWSRSKPTIQMLNRLIELAKEASKVLTSHLLHPTANFDHKVLFRPPLEPYDVIIHLKPMLVPTLDTRVDGRPSRPNEDERPPRRRTTSPGCTMPVLNYNPVVSYLEELREAFDDFALFFYDHYGGLYVAVLWKPPAFEPRPFKVPDVSGRMISGHAKKEGSVLLVPNTTAIIEDFAIMGRGLVKTVETCSEKWTFVD